MANIMLTPARVRSLVSGCRTEKDVESSLRSHGIRFSYDTTGGYLSIRIPARSGAVRVYRAASRSAPFLVSSVPPVPAYPVPILHRDY